MNIPDHNASGRQIHEESQRRPDLSSLHVREDVAITGLCGNVHMNTGLTCDQPERHGGSCHFVGPEDTGKLTAN